MGSYTGGKWQSLPEKLAAQSKGSMGPRSRGGKRGANKDAKAAAPMVVPVAKVTKAVKAKAAPTMTKGSMKRTAVPKAEISVKDIKQTIAPMTSTGIAKTKRNISVGGLVGRTGGKWHLGKKVGKG